MLSKPGPDPVETQWHCRSPNQDKGENKRDSMEILWNSYGLPMEQHRSNAGATPEQHRASSLCPGHLAAGASNSVYTNIPARSSPGLQRMGMGSGVGPFGVASNTASCQWREQCEPHRRRQHPRHHVQHAGHCQCAVIGRRLLHCRWSPTLRVGDQPSGPTGRPVAPAFAQ